MRSPASPATSASRRSDERPPNAFLLRASSRGGFTLIEVLIALAILGAHRRARLSRRRLRSPTSETRLCRRIGSAGAPRRALRAPRSRSSGRRMPRDVRMGAVTEPAWSAATDDAGNAVAAPSRAPDRSSRRSRERRTAYRLSAARRQRGNSRIGRTSTSPPASRRRSIRWRAASPVSRSPIWMSAAPGTIAGRCSASRRCRARSASELTLDDGERIERWFTLR